MNKLRSIREKLGMTQKDLADTLGISRSQVGNIEQGIREITPRIERDLINYLNINPKWLASGVGEIILGKYDSFDLDDKEKEFLELYESLDDDSKNLIMETMKKIVPK